MFALACSNMLEHAWKACSNLLEHWKLSHTAPFVPISTLFDSTTNFESSSIWFNEVAQRKVQIVKIKKKQEKNKITFFKNCYKIWLVKYLPLKFCTLLRTIMICINQRTALTLKIFYID